MASKEMEQLKAVMKMMMEKGFAPKFDGEMDPIHLREVVQAAQERMSAEPGIEFIPADFNGVEGEISMPEEARKDAIILYIHGGGMICGNAFTSRGYASMLAGESRMPVYSLSYRLAPEEPYPAGVEDCFNYYKGLAETNPDTPIFLVGESAGGYFSLVTAMKARDAGVKVPAGVVPYSAPIDFAGRIDHSFEGNEDFTVTLDGINAMSRMYVSVESENDKYAHPYLDDFKNLPPMLLAWDENESLAVDQKIIVDRIQAVGGEVNYKSYPHCFHAFATTGRGTPESYGILKDTISFFEAHI